MNKSGLNLPAGEWSSLNNSIQVRTQTVNKIPNKSISGLAPFLIIVFTWLEALISSILTWQLSSRQKRNFKTVSGEVLAAVINSSVVTATITFFAHTCYGVPVPNMSQFIGLVFFSCLVFILIQLAVLDLVGFIGGWPILLIVWLLSAGVLSYAPQMLDSFYRNWIYSWTPIRFGLDTIANTLYMPNSLTMNSDLWILSTIGICALIVMYLLLLIKRNSNKNK